MPQPLGGTGCCRLVAAGGAHAAVWDLGSPGKPVCVQALNGLRTVVAGAVLQETALLGTKDGGLLLLSVHATHDTQRNQQHTAVTAPLPSQHQCEQQQASQRPPDGDLLCTTPLGADKCDVLPCHEASVNCIVADAARNHYVTCSDDGGIKVCMVSHLLDAKVSVG
jgi:hypothetical protein